MSGNFWCFGCGKWINNKTFIIIKCSDEECGNCDYFCDNLCIENVTFNRNIDLTKCNCCECDIIKKIIKIN